MRRSRYTEKEILNILKEARHAPRIGDVIRRHHINPKTYYRWKAKYGDSRPSGRLLVRHLKAENERLKLLVAKQALEIEALEDGKHTLRGRRGRGGSRHG